MQTYHFTLQESFLMPVLDNGHAKVVHFSFPKGKVLERHKAPSDILIFILSGQIQFQHAQQTTELRQGDMVSLEKNVEHSLTALEDSVVALVLTPSPSSQSAASKQSTSEAPPVHNLPPQGVIAPQLQSFVEEHADLLQALAHAQKEQLPEAYLAAGNQVRDELNQHFRYEEEFLFPVLGKYIGTTTGPVAVMLGEHKLIRDAYNRFEEKRAASSQVTDEVQQTFQVLADILRAHIMKEDNMLFPMASQALSEAEKDEVARLVAGQKHK